MLTCFTSRRFCRLRGYLVGISLSLLYPSFSLSQCPNMGFEEGTFSGWTGGFGCSTPDGLTVDFDNCQYIKDGVVVTYGGENMLDKNGPLNDGTSQHAIVAANFNGGGDPYVNELSLRSPLGGNYIARIGDLYNGRADGPDQGKASQVRKTITVNEHNTMMTLYYAIVLQDPEGSHSEHEHEEIPFFHIRLKDPSGEPVECIEYTVTSEGDQNGFAHKELSDQGPEGRLRDIKWRNWTTITINLLDYVGQTVEVVISTSDCGKKTHLGYCYLDYRCGPMELIRSEEDPCSKEVTLIAPDGLDGYHWSNGEAGKSITVDESGTYTCELVPFSNTGVTCPFELDKTIEVTEGSLTAAFSLPEEGCVSQQVQMTNQSEATGSSLVSHQWKLGDGTTSSDESSVSHSFYQAGRYNVSLEVTDDQGCKDLIEKEIHIHPAPAPRFSADPVCLGEAIELLDVTSGNSTNEWMIEGQRMQGESVLFTFNQPGYHTVSLFAKNEQGCEAEEKKAVFVSDLPNVDFDLSPAVTDIWMTDISVRDQTDGDVALREWNFANLGEGSEYQEEFQFPSEPGTYEVELIVRNNFGCEGKRTKELLIEGSYSLFVPNAFSPNGDGENDGFLPVHIGLDEEGWELAIFDRWGNLMFYSEDNQEAWNGTFPGSSEECMMDTYVWKLRYSASDGYRTFRRSGSVNLLR